MKKSILFLFLLIGTKGYSQLYLKGSALGFSLDAGTSYYLSGAVEFRYKYFALEYMRHKQKSEGEDLSHEDYTHQILGKIYFGFLNESLRNVYVAPLFRIVNGFQTETDYVTQKNGSMYGFEEMTRYKGSGFGFMLGKNFDFNTFIGMELGFYYYGLNLNHNDYMINNEISPINEGMRIYLYLKTPPFVKKSE